MINEIYDKLDSNNSYERTWGYINPTSAAYWRMRDEIVFENILKVFDPLVEPLKILEIGTGHGHEIAKFAQIGIPQSRLIGIDLVFKRLVWAEKLYPSITFIQQDGEKLGFVDQSFDIVFEFNCLAHAETIENQRSACLEMTRVLKPGGLIIWFDIAPVTWPTVCCSQLCKAISGKTSFRKSFSLIKRIILTSFCPKGRQNMLKSYGADYLLPISCQDIFKFFPNLDVQARYIGLDYTIWEFLWKRNRILAQKIWRTGWLWRHSFAVIQKPSM